MRINSAFIVKEWEWDVNRHPHHTKSSNKCPVLILHRGTQAIFLLLN